MESPLHIVGAYMILSSDIICSQSRHPIGGTATARASLPTTDGALCLQMGTVRRVFVFINNPWHNIVLELRDELMNS